MLNVANSLYLPQWGQQAGENVRQGRLEARQEERRNRLAELLPSAYSGDPNALNLLAQASPEAYLSLQDNLYQRQQAGTKLKRENLELSRGQFLDETAGALASVAQLPEEQREAAWQQRQAALMQKYPTFVDQEPDSWATAQAFAPQMAAMDKKYEALFGRYGLIPQEPAAPAGPTDDIQEYQFAQKDGFTGSFDQWMARKAQQSGGGSPFFQFLPGADGYLVGNARTGQIAPGMVNGQRAIPGALDPRLQGELVTAKEGAKAGVERNTAKQERTRSADDALSLLDEAETILSLPSTTGSVGGNLVDKTAGAVGMSTEGAQSTARLKTIGGQLVAKMPRMEGPQSNYDVQLYRDMAGQLDDPTVPTPTRMEALRQIRRLNEKYASQQPAAEGGASGSWAVPEGWSVRKR